MRTRFLKSLKRRAETMAPSSFRVTVLWDPDNAGISAIFVRGAEAVESCSKVKWPIG